MKNRLVRVRELLQRELGAIIARDHAFPSVLVTVNDVDITPDLKHAYFFVGIIGPEDEAERVVETLNRQHGELQTRVSKRVILKNTPHFHFRLDRSVERGIRVTGIMETIDRQLAESAARDAAAGIAAPPPGIAGRDDDEMTDEEDDPESESVTDPDDLEKDPEIPVSAKRSSRSPRDRED